MAAAVGGGLVLGMDSSPGNLAQASRRNWRAIEEGACGFIRPLDALPWPSRSVSKILAVNVVYFFDVSGDEVREARRLLRPGGLMAIYATHKETMRHWKFSGPDTHVLDDEAELNGLLLRGGFGPEDVSVRRVKLAFGIQGLLALARKSGT